MSPKHGEVVKDIGNGFTIAWDTTWVDKALLGKMESLVSKQSSALNEIIAANAVKSNEGSGSRRDSSPAESPV
jgi:hypothetical protein